MAAKIIAPQAGPQTRFCQSPADILVFGGEAGGGKSWILAYEAGKWADVPGYGGILFRRDTTQLIGPGGLWEKARELYTPMGAELTQSPTLTAKWNGGAPLGAEIHLRHLEHEWTVEAHDGKEYAFVGLDEGQYFTEKMIWYMWGRCRTKCGVKPYMRITCNPDPDCYLRTLLDWWIDPETGYPIPERDGVLRWCLRLGDDLQWFASEQAGLEHVARLQIANPENPEYKHMAPISVSFIRSRLADNPALLEHDPTYGARLAMQDADTRAKKLGGNWNARAKAGEMFDRAWFDMLAAPDPTQIAFSVRAWDKAATQPSDRNPDPDWTRGVLWHHMRDGRIVIADLVSCRLAPGGVDRLVRDTAEDDGPAVVQAFWRDPAQAGLVDEEHMKGVLRGLPCRVSFVAATKDKVAYARPWSAYADPQTSNGVRLICVVRAGWNKELFAELDKFPKPSGESGRGVHDDIVDACSRAWVEISGRKHSGAARFLQGMQNVAAPKKAPAYFTGG